MKKIAFNFEKLRRKIRGKYDRMKDFAVELNLDATTLSKKLNNVTDFTASEILKASELLDIPINELDTYFFEQKVREIEQSGLTQI